ncbi:hypothetical protein GQS40_08970|uniref:Uncharacterized protein n=1 Tax=Leuconostoc lactis TaxID=1246 RepID=A0A6L7ABH3_LEULA|nr:hypothetical protein [Leuconostoc lactis]
MLIIASLINLFFYNGIVSLLISGVTVIIFALYTAYDNQNLKVMYGQYAGQVDTTGLAVNGALRLYLEAFGLLMAFAVIEGLTLGLLLAVYTGASVMMAFASAASVFGGMALYGVFTKRDLTGMGSILFGMLIGFFKQTYSFMGIAVLVTAFTGFIVQKFFLAQVYALIAGNLIGTLALFGIQILIMTMIGRATFKNPARDISVLILF